MAMKTVQISECDRCGKAGAHTWVITGPEGGTREIELCERHSAAVANAFALARPIRRTMVATRRTPAPRRPSPPPEPEPEPQWR